MATRAEVTQEAYRARGGVIAGTGGFAHNAGLRRHYLSGPVVGTARVASHPA